MKNNGIFETKYYDNLKGIDVVSIEVGSPLLGTFSTKIARWKDGKHFQLHLSTTPKVGLIETDKDFDSVKEAKDYYVKNLKILLEDTLDIINNALSPKKDKVMK